jgi:hypothetical protein
MQLDQPTLAKKINDAIEGYREKKEALEKFKLDMRRAEEHGEAVSEELTALVDRTGQLLDCLRRALVALQNDYLRQHLAGGRIMMTAGVQSQGPVFITQAFAAIAAFNSFTADNDPYGEHDFGAIEIAGTKLLFKIDAYDRDLRYGSLDPADPDLTVRVLTIMLAEEY